MKEIQINKELPVIKMNFEEVKGSLQETMKKYEGIIVTEEGLKDCKATQKDLASLRNKIDTYRKDVKREMLVPIDIFEYQCKELISQISDVEKPIKEGIKIFDDKRREEKRQKALELIKESVINHNLSKEYALKLTVKNEYLNLSKSLKSVREDIESRVLLLEREQEDEKQRKEMLRVSIENAISVANEGINTKLKFEDFTKYIEFGWPLDRILKEINDKATMIKEAEKPKVEIKEPVQTPLDISKPVENIKKEVKEEIKQDKFFVDVHVEHNFEMIQALSKFLKDNGYNYEVHKKGKVK
ncbi:DUF1351 domain-containing protein [Clostridium perfringens]|uniref:DUF1351 domain-containing protein n=1 Tax=Clostridium perfringens TaxID=1502 RepID=UPI0024BC82F8|nr:DUF1351 domain-containing protein [Clostridium perfringens]